MVKALFSIMKFEIADPPPLLWKISSFFKACLIPIPIFSALFLVLTAVLAYWCWLLWAPELEERRGHLLPGPKPWPIIGSLHLMANFKKYPFEVFTKLQQVIISLFSCR